ncbi:hypothetical protein GCM10007082_24500 [Oceanisphaera arctica]|nr:hypothetical protein GCM10007082_24500 [Oceanisphaera arctica]
MLKDKGYEVTVITSNRNNVNNEVLADLDCLGDVKVIRCQYPYNAFGFFVFIRNVCKKISELRVGDSDFILSRSHWGVISVRLSGVKKINYLAPSVYFLQEKLDKDYMLSSKMLRYLINSIGQFFAFLFSDVFVFSQDMKKQVQTSCLGGCNPVVINPGVSSDRFHCVDEIDKRLLRDRLKLDGAVKYLLCVGRLSEIKQFDIAIKSLKSLEEKYHLLIVGSGPELEYYKSLLDSEGVSERVVIRPFTKDVDLYYKTSDIYLMTSRYESFGQVLLEATCCGLPVIAFSKSSGVRTSVSYIYEGFNFLLKECDKQSPSSLARTINGFEFDRKALNEEASEFSEKYNWSAAIDTIILDRDL